MATEAMSTVDVVSRSSDGHPQSIEFISSTFVFLFSCGVGQETARPGIGPTEG